jgi:hypothetical protein
MATITLEYETPEDKDELDCAFSALELRAVIQRYDEELHLLQKYNSDSWEYKDFSVERARTRLWTIIRDEGVEKLFNR